MTFRINQFYVALCIVHLGTFTYTIRVPGLTTTVKPPNHREPSLPWYLNKTNLQPPEDVERSAKWSTDYEEIQTRKPVIVDSGTKSWTPWHKISGSEIEQRSEITDDKIYEQHDQDQFDRKPPPSPPQPENKKRYSTNFTEDFVFPEYENVDVDVLEKEPEHKLPKDNEEIFYEGISPESTKPRQERIYFPTSPEMTIARYDPELGVQCPTPISTGQFTYPPDCKYFVNCWKGRAFVQPCAPGTLFNPETLECDFPHKVKCYEMEISDMAYTGSNRLEKAKCPPYVTGLVRHPTNCSKFLQCVNGGTIEMDCGPNTVFNPAISNCDWPRNVKGCEDALQSGGNTNVFLETPKETNVYNHEANGHDDKLKYTGQPVKKKVECPQGATGHFPHPETCRKFLQCANGVMYVMDCGPGTAFNPKISTCDWPYNVPACKEEKTSQQTTTTSSPWPGHETSEIPKEYHRIYPNHYRHYNHGQWGQGSPIVQNQLTTTTTELPRPTWQPSYQPVTWKPMPNYDNWTPRNEYNPINVNRGYNNQIQPPPGHYHGYGHHHHHQYPGHSMNEDNCTNSDGHTYHHHQHHHYHHGHHPHNEGAIEPDRRPETLPPMPNAGHTWNRDHIGPNVQHNPWLSSNNPPMHPNVNANGPYMPEGQGRNEYGSTVPPNENRRMDSFYPQHGNNHGTSNPQYDNTEEHRLMNSGKNLYINNTDKLPGQDEFRNRTDRMLGNYPKPNEINNTWNRPVTSNGQPNQSSNRPWNQEEPPFPVYYIPAVQPISQTKRSEPPTPISGQVIRLRDGSGPESGYVEVQGAQPGWGIVCDSRNNWTLKEAHVVCRQLGYTRGAEMAWQGRNRRSGTPTWIAANSVTCYGNETKFQSCKFTHGQECSIERDAIGVRCSPNRVAHCRKDEIPHEGQCYHLALSNKGLHHAEALEYCSQRGARLIDITSQAENNFVSEWLLQSYPQVGSIMTAGVGFKTLQRTLWFWKDSKYPKIKFSKWWPGWMEDKSFPPSVGTRPTCIIMKRKFPCHNRPESICVADYFFWDVEDCANSTKGHSYICKRPYDDIGCVYGNGNQYFGKVNVTASGLACLPWSDPTISRYLTLKIISSEVKEKLRSHNYCRNPTPNTESSPWCFTSRRGEWEYCDIPPCGNVVSKRLLASGQCKPKHFQCLPGECIPIPWVCDGAEDCTNGADEQSCTVHMDSYQKHAKHRLEGYDVEKWLNTPLKTCALRCRDADFICRSFAHKASENICLLSGDNIGSTGALKPSKEFDYYEMKERSINCDNMFVCENKKCINKTLVCNGRNDCNDRSDESICTINDLDYDIRLAGTENSEEGRIEVKYLGVWGQVCDDAFDMNDANVICKELGFQLGALEIKPGGFYGNMEPSNRFMVDQLKCRGNETSLRHCDFEGWGVHNCEPEEAVGIVCKTIADTCQEGHWKCDNTAQCVTVGFICDSVQDCDDGSDENDQHCNAPFEIRLANGSSPMEGRVEVRHHGIWGTVCDDDFSAASATVICRSLGYNGTARPVKDAYFGSGEGPIWLDQVDCRGNEMQLYRCDHNDWGLNNCDHNEDAGVICSLKEANDNTEPDWKTGSSMTEPSIEKLLPTDCGKRPEDYDYDEDLIFAKVVQGSVAPKGTYPWQASIRVRGHSGSSHWCGAVVLSPLHVLTAAHCLQGYNKGTYFVRAGDYNMDIDEGTEQEANIEDYYIHEEFRKNHRMNNDIALVLLKGRGIALGKDIMPICLPPENAEYPAGLNCTISGFGSIETGKKTPSKDLRFGWVPLVDQSICRADYVYGQGRVSDGMVCAGFLDEGVDTCDGDSGGPLVCNRNGAFTLYGITSWGQHCGDANKPGVYVRVAYYRRWIDQKIRESLSGI